MGPYFSADRCSAVFGIEPNCSVPSPLPISLNAPFLGNVQRGAFEANPDIAGVGILIGFFGVTYCALLCHLIGMILVVTASIRGRKPYGVLDSIRRFAFACSDQQLFTGLAYTVSIRYRNGCTLSAYHYAIAQKTLLVVAITQALASGAFISPSNKDLGLTLLRLVGAIPFWVLGSLFLGVRVDEVFQSDQDGPLFALPALCFMPRTTDPLSATDAPEFRTSGFEFSQTAGLFTAAIIFWGFSVAGTILRETNKRIDQHDFRRPSPGSNDLEDLDGTKGSKVAAAFFSIIIALALFLLIFTTRDVYSLRARVYASGWMEVAEGNAEEDISALGQLIPVVLLVLTFYPIVDIMSNKE